MKNQNMKTMRNLLLAGMITLFCCSIANAQIVYSNNFSLGGAVDISGTVPTTANDFAGGTSSAIWNNVLNNDTGMLANGTVDGSPTSVLLPFTPQPGYLYTLTASVTWNGDPSCWIGLGFCANDSTDVPLNYARFSDSGNGGPEGYDWLIALPTSASEQWFAGPKGNPKAGLASSNMIASNGTYTLQLNLDTTGIKWTISSFIDGTQFGTNYSYSGNPTIGAVGYTQNSLGAPANIQWNSITLTAVAVPITNNTYWVAPTAIGANDGSSSDNAASYLDSGFWSGVQSLLQVTNINVNFVNGAYNTGTLNLNDMGNPLHRLTLQAVNLYGPVFNSTGNAIVSILGSQNIKFDGILFTGNVQYWGVECQPDYLKPCRNLEFSNCQFVDLTNVVYGAIGLVNGVRDVFVNNCTFKNLTDNNGNHQHMIYASHNIVGVTVTNCLFQDCLADYVRFRDDSEYCTIENCQFISTMSASAWPFISAELYNVTNSDSAGDEFFGNYIQISSNSFTYNVSGGPGPYSALHFSDTGYSPQSYDCDLTSAQANQLANGTTGFQRSFLQTNMGIIASGIKIFGNTYNSRVSHVMDYTYNWDGIQPNGGWSGTVDISNVPDSSSASLGPTPVLRNGNFDRQGLLLTPVSQGLKNWQCLFRTWFCNPKYTDILRHPGFDGTTNALLFDKTQNQYVFQWITPPGRIWTMDCQFAIGSGFTGSGVKFKVDIFHNDITGGKVSVGVDNSGRFGIYNGGSFTVLSELGTVSFSVDNNSNGNYIDPGDTLNVYHLRIVGNYSASTPYLNIYTSDANGHTLNHQSLRRAYWVNSAPTSGQSSPETIAFYNYTAPVIVDQVAFASDLAEQPPVITSVLLNDGRLVFSGTNGFAGDNYYLFTSTNLASGNWTLESSNTFDANGAFSITNTVAPGAPQEFYRMQLQ
jgi:hypothetical protein